VDELVRLKARAKSESGQIAIFFVDDNFAINIKRTKSLLRDIISAEAQLPWIAQISANLLRDEELIDLIAEAGCRMVFIGMESVDPVNLADVNKSFNKPGEYAAVLKRLERRDIYAVTSFIFGMDNDTPGVAERTLEQIRSWPPGLPVFGQLTPFPATPLYTRLEAAGRLTRPTHWLDFAPYQMAHTPLKMTIPEAQIELEHAWASSYSPERIAEALESIGHKSVGWRIYHLILRLSFRGIYFPQMNKRSWLKLLNQNRGTIFSLTREVISLSLGRKRRKSVSVPSSQFSAIDTEAIAVPESSQTKVEV
jgi:radical SAM superfamily enzyme YgiQ (UPF0313 family)